MFLQSRNTSFLSTTLLNTFFWPILPKKKGILKKFRNFGQNHGLTPLEKCQFATFLNRCCHSLEMLVFYLERY